MNLLQKEKKNIVEGSRTTARHFSMVKILPSFDKLLKFDNYWGELCISNKKLGNGTSVLLKQN